MYILLYSGVANPDMAWPAATQAKMAPTSPGKEFNVGHKMHDLMGIQKWQEMFVN